MNRNQAIADCRRNMYRAAVDADHETRLADQMNELQNCGVIEEVDAIFRHRDLALALAHENNPVRGKSMTKFFHREVAE